MQNRENLLWLAQTGKHFGQRPSRLIGIREESVALDLDLACTARLTEFENKRDYKRLESLVKSFAVMAAGMFGQKIDPKMLDDSEAEHRDEEIDDNDPDVW